MARIYISSTFGDLEDYRREVYHTLRRMGHDVIAMEDYVASPRRPLEDCLSDVAACELYVGVFAWRYGFIPAAANPEEPGAGNPEQKSITELEYLHAAKLGKDRLIFLLHENAPWPKRLIEGGPGAERIEAFRRRLCDEHVVDFFEGLGDLTTKVSTAVSVWQDARKAGDSSDPSGIKAEDQKPRAPEVNVAHLPVTGGLLFGRENELEALDEAWEGGGTHVISFIAWGGVGKSALVNKWLSNLARGDYRGAERVYAWSFYRQGTGEQGVSADQFIDAALRWFGDPDPTAGTPWDKGERLARLIRRQRTLLLLDGVEPLQFPPGRGHREGALKEHSMQALLRELAAHNPGLCVITSRLPVADLAASEGVTARRINLEHLSPQAGAEILRDQGVTGGQAELEQASAEFGGHALALTLLGSYLKNVYEGDITRRNRVGLLIEDEEQGGHARRVMASYEQWFGEGAELSVLRILGLFDRPADGPSVTALRAAPAIPGLTDALQGITEERWLRTLTRLRNAKLIAGHDPRRPGALDTHPLVREYFKQQLKRDRPDSWREGNSRLYEHLKETTEEFPGSIEAMTPLYSAVAHGCAAGRDQEALDDVYYRRIRRGDAAFSFKMLGAFGADLAALTSFFERPWQQLAAGLTESDKAFILNETGSALRALGQMAEATQPVEAGLEMCIRHQDWHNSASDANNLSDIYLAAGDLSRSLDYARKCIELADLSESSFLRASSRTKLGNVLFRLGRLPEAEAVMQEAEGLEKSDDPAVPFLFSVRGFDYCTLLLHQGKYQEVQVRASQTLAVAVQNRSSLLTIALDRLSLGRAFMLQARSEPTHDFHHAEEHLNQSVDGLRQAALLEFLSYGLLARAELYRVSGEFDRAEANVSEAMSIATRGGMGLHQADCHLEYARLYLAEDEEEKAREHWLKAKEMVGRMGYHLRDGDVEEIGRELEGA